MKRVLILFLAVALLMSGCKKENYVENSITMTTVKSGEVVFYMEGSGSVTIDWGDGSEIETHTLSAYDDYYPSDLYRHTYNETTDRTITITGGNITHLDCADNQLTNLDVSDYTTLVELFCHDNQLINLNVSGCTALINLYCYNNRLTNLNLRDCKELVNFACSSNKITSLEIRDCTMLYYLECSNNRITSLNVEGCIALVQFYCNSNQISKLDVSDCIDLWFFGCDFNNLTFSELNALFGTLFSLLPITTNQVVSIRGNPGTDDCDRSIAERKGWKVID